MGIVFPLQNYANMKSLKTVIVLNAVSGAVILLVLGYICVLGDFFSSFLGSVPAEVTGVRFHCVWRQTTRNVFTEFNVKQ